MTDLISRNTSIDSINTGTISNLVVQEKQDINSQQTGTGNKNSGCGNSETNQIIPDFKNTNSNGNIVRNLPNENNNNNNQEPKEGIISRFFSYLKRKSPWYIEEEEFIDAHGFKAKRPKHKIPVVDKKDKDNQYINKIGAETLTSATHHSGFGNLFL